MAAGARTLIVADQVHIQNLAVLPGPQGGGAGVRAPSPAAVAARQGQPCLREDCKEVPFREVVGQASGEDVGGVAEARMP